MHRPEVFLYIVGLGSALVLSLLLTYGVRSVARRAGWFDFHDDRKTHTQLIPRIGGVAIFVTVNVVLGVAALLFDELRQYEIGRNHLLIVLIGAAMMHLVGLADDIRNIRARWKLMLQVAIALAVYLAGVRVTTLSLPGIGIVELGTWLGLLFTVFWLVGITNAFNLIDGLDGLAGGAALFALTTLFFVASTQGMVDASFVTIVVAGAVLGFLFFNFHPASIFLGDSGSLFLGFMLAGMGLLSSQKGSTAVAVAIPVVSLGLPVIDTLLAIIRRFLRGQPIFSADRGHIHHRLLNLGHSPRKVALLLYGACAVLALGGMLLVNDSGYVALVLLLVGLGVFVAMQRLRFHEFEELGRVIRRGISQRGNIGRTLRVRETSSRMSQVQALEDVFGLLQALFADDKFQRAEVRLRAAFMDVLPSGAVQGATLSGRQADDFAIWTWSRSGEAELNWWEIHLPLQGPGGECIGHLVLWQDDRDASAGLSHLHAIASDLRQEIQRKLLSLWHVGAVTPPDDAGRAVVATDVSRAVTATDDVSALRTAEGHAAAGGAPADRSSQTSGRRRARYSQGALDTKERTRLEATTRIA